MFTKELEATWISYETIPGNINSLTAHTLIPILYIEAQPGVQSKLCLSKVIITNKSVVALIVIQQ